MRALLRPVFISLIALRYGLDGLVLDSLRSKRWSAFARILVFGRRLNAPRGQRLREALERLGPIFVKFGQMLSTRRDHAPQGLAGGGPAVAGRQRLFRNDESIMELPGCFSVSVLPGEAIEIETPGGGGFGRDGSA